MTDTQPNIQPSQLSIQDVLKVLPHRYPFMLIDRVLSHGGGLVHAVKNVSIGEPYFQGHFPQEPVMPGVLIIEALAQASMFAIEIAPGSIGYLAGLEGVRFKRKVVPGDVLHLHVRLEFLRRGLGKTSCRAEVDGEVAAEATVLFALSKPGS